MKRALLYPYQQAMVDEIMSHPDDPTTVREAVYAIRHYIRSHRRRFRNRLTEAFDPWKHGDRAFDIVRQFNLTAYPALWA